MRNSLDITFIGFRFINKNVNKKGSPAPFNNTLKFSYPDVPEAYRIAMVLKH
jgi:hypothetical protein